MEVTSERMTITLAGGLGQRLRALARAHRFKSAASLASAAVSIVVNAMEQGEPEGELDEVRKMFEQFGRWEPTPDKTVPPKRARRSASRG